MNFLSILLNQTLTMPVAEESTVRNNGKVNSIQSDSAMHWALILLDNIDGAI